PLYHTRFLSHNQVDQLHLSLGIPADDVWASFPPDSPEGRLCREMADRLYQPAELRSAPISVDDIPPALGVRHPNETSTQEALGRILPRVASLPGIGERVVTIAPDVATSTHLGGWINRVGIFAPAEQPDYEADGPQILRWRESPAGQHIELG